MTEILMARQSDVDINVTGTPVDKQLAIWTAANSLEGDPDLIFDGSAAKLSIDQASTSGAKPVLQLDQGDIDDTFINYVGTSAADGTRSISSDTTEDASKFGAFRIEINGVTKWIRIYDDHS